MASERLIGKGREAIRMIVDSDTMMENVIGEYRFEPGLGPGAVVGAALLDGHPVTVIANDAMAVNPRFRAVYAGLIGLEEGFKMASAVYLTVGADRDSAPAEKRPILLIVDTPGNGAGKVEELVGIHKATGAYQMALAEARKKGHPVVAIVIGRAISGGFLCHGLQADRILSLSSEFGTMIHVMPLTSIARITKTPIQRLQELANTNPVFAAGADFFYRLGGVEEIVTRTQDMREALLRHIREILEAKAAGRMERLGPMGRGLLGAERGGRKTREVVIRKMREEFESILHKFENVQCKM